MRGRDENVTDEKLHDTIDAIVSVHLQKMKVVVSVTKHTATMVSGHFDLTFKYPAHGSAVEFSETIDLRSFPRKIQLDYVHCVVHGMCAAVLTQIYG